MYENTTRTGIEIISFNTMAALIDIFQLYIIIKFTAFSVSVQIAFLVWILYPRLEHKYITYVYENAISGLNGDVYLDINTVFPNFIGVVFI